MKTLITLLLVLNFSNSFASISCTAFDNITNKDAKITEFKNEKIIRINSALEDQSGSIFNAIVKTNGNNLSLEGGIHDRTTTHVDTELLPGQNLQLSIVADGGAGPSLMLAISCKNN